jgi:beta-glucosidase
MAGGEALARVLVGDDEPAGRLPFTVPLQMTDAPCDISRADPPGHLRYTEGLAVGHRWYLTRDIEPRWWFGAGQGYTSFEWHTPSAPSSWAPGTPLLVSLPVTNVGDRDGVEVAQVYLGRQASIVDRPRWAFGGSTKARIAAGATAVLSIEIDPATIRHWDGDRGWTIEPGPLELRVACSAGDPGQVLTVNIA